MRVLRLCSVFEAPEAALDGRGVRFDPVGGMQNHTAQLMRREKGGLRPGGLLDRFQRGKGRVVELDARLVP
jgi:hypothetical protein